ncbi:MAG: glucose-1-phosphate cytidylyltransferase, partial [Candidatus Eremiobacteraeota bacterium]|nr:glucose-1-phosphate cytidylyltransferase [Candidatus Eremiobacteraeota bacterium]
VHGHAPVEDWNVTLAETGLDAMTGCRIKRVEKYTHGDTFMVTYGDGVADVDVRAVLNFHHAHRRLATVTTVRPTSRFGMVEVGDDGGVTQFAEKPQMDGWVNAGYFVFHRKVFDYLGGDDCVMEREPLERLAADGQLIAYRHDGFFFAMDTYREYVMLNDMWNAGEAPWKVWP